MHILAVSVSLISIAITTVIVGLTAALLMERARRLDLTERVKHLESLLANLERVGRNKLYREAIENKQASAVQAALRLRVAKRDLEDALAILELRPKD